MIYYSRYATSQQGVRVTSQRTKCFTVYGRSVQYLLSMGVPRKAEVTHVSYAGFSLHLVHSLSQNPRSASVDLACLRGAVARLRCFVDWGRVFLLVRHSYWVLYLTCHYSLPLSRPMRPLPRLAAKNVVCGGADYWQPQASIRSLSSARYYSSFPVVESTCRCLQRRFAGDF